MTIYPGMRAANAQGPLGTVIEINSDPGSGMDYVVVEDQTGLQTQLPLSEWAVEDGVLLLGPLPAQLASAGQSAPVTQALIPPADELRTDASQLGPGQVLKVPVIAEQAVVETRQVAGGGVRIHKTVHERQEVVEHPVIREEVDVRRVPINQYVEAAPAIREEGDTTIIPVLEEVLVVEKRLMLKEEIHVTRRRSTETQQTAVTLREEQVELERLDPLGAQQEPIL